MSFTTANKYNKLTIVVARCRKCAEILMFWAAEVFLGGEGPQISDPDRILYIWVTVKHVAKFADGLRD